MLALRVCDPLLPRLAREFGVGIGEVAATVTGYAMAYGVVQIIFGPLGDRFGKQRTMSVAAALAALCNLLVSQAPTLATLVAARVAAGAAAGGVIPLAIALVGDAVPLQRRQQALARLLLATLGGMICGQCLGGLIGSIAGWRPMFAGLAVSFAACSLMLYSSRGPVMAAAHAAQAVPASVVEGVRRVLIRPQVRLVLLCTAIEGALAFSLLTFVPYRLQAVHHASAATAGGSVALFGLGGLIFALSTRAWLRRLTLRALVQAGGAMVGVSALALALSPAVLIIHVTNVLGGFGLYMLHSSLQTMATHMAPEHRGTGVALFVTALFVGQAEGVAVGTAFMQLGCGTTVLATCAAGVTLLGYWLGMRWHDGEPN